MADRETSDTRGIPLSMTMKAGKPKTKPKRQACIVGKPAKKKTRTANELLGITVETLVVHRWQCPECSLEHELSKEEAVEGTIVICDHEGLRLGCLEGFRITHVDDISSKEEAQP